jgi:hypothetical protein
MVFGQANFNGKAEVVEIIKRNSKTTIVRRTYKQTPIGKQIKLHNIKHNIKIHGENIIRKDLL